MNKKRAFPEFIICLISVVSAAFLVFFLASVEINRSLTPILVNVLLRPYFPVTDSMFMPYMLGPVPINIFIYVTFLVSLIFLSIMRKFLMVPKIPLRPFAGLKAPVTVSLVLFFFILVSSALSAGMDSLVMLKNFSGKATHEKTALSLGLPFYLGMFCRNKLPGKHKGEFITDLDLSQDLPMTFHRRLAYFMYPIDIRNITDRPKDCVLISFTKNPQEHIPKEHTGLFWFDKKNLLITKKE